MRLLRRVTVPGGETFMVTVQDPSWWQALLLRDPQFFIVRGSGTVWRDARTGRRLPTTVEAELTDLAQLESQVTPKEQASWRRL